MFLFVPALAFKLHTLRVCLIPYGLLSNACMTLPHKHDPRNSSLCLLNSLSLSLFNLLSDFSSLRLHQLKSAVVSVSVLAHLICPPFLLHPPTSSVLTSLASLLTHCLNAATAAACSVAGLKSDLKTPGGGPTGSGGKSESTCAASSIVELLSLISYCQTPSPASVATAKTLAHDIATLTVTFAHIICCTCNASTSTAHLMCYSLYITCLLQLKVFSKLLEVAKKLPGHKANVRLYTYTFA